MHGRAAASMKMTWVYLLVFGVVWGGAAIAVRVASFDKGMQDDAESDEQLQHNIFNFQDPRRQQKRLKGYGRRAVNAMNNNSEGAQVAAQ